MALKKSGIELVVKGFADYLNTVNEAMKNNDLLTSSFVKTASQTNRAFQSMAKAYSEHERHLSALAKSREAASRAQAKANEEAVVRAKIELEVEKQRTLQMQFEYAKQSAEYKAYLEARMAAFRAYLREMERQRRQQAKEAETATGGAGGNVPQLPSGLTAVAGGGDAWGAIFAAAAGALTGIGAVVAAVVATFKVLEKAISIVTGVVRSFTGVIGGAIKFVVSLAENVLKLAAAIAGVLVKAFLALASIVGKVLGAVVNLGKSLLDMVTSPIRSGLQWISDQFGKIGPTLIALLTRDVLGKLASGFKDMSAAMITAIGQFQKLNIQFESLVARDIAHTLGIPIADAFSMVETKAYGLLRWVKQFAVMTPFSAEKIAETLAMANAYGLSAMEAKQLTIATADFTSAMGLSGDEMFRIVYNFGQMYSMGKLTGREFRDLANAFVPVYDILGKMAQEAGMARDKFIELAFSGGVPVKEFFDEFISYVSEAFPNAAERMAYTWDAVKSNIKDFINIVLGTNILGPVFDDLTKKMAGMLIFLMEPEFQTATEKIGLAVKYAFDQITKAVTIAWQAIKFFISVAKPAFESIFNVKLPEMPGLDSFLEGIVTVGVAIRNLATIVARYIRNQLPEDFSNALIWIRDTLVPMAEKAFDWGVDFITQFAQGMINGAVGAITAAVNFISALLTSWFQIHSPPRILPLIDEWGIKTAALWMQGWENIDYSALDSVQGLLSGALQGLFNIGVIEDEKMVDKLFVNLSKDMIEAIKNFNKTGEMSAEMFAKLRALGGGFGDELAKLLEIQVEMVRAVDAQAAAERRLLAAQKARERAEYNLNKQISAYNAALRGGAGRAEMRNRLGLVNADEISLDLARKEEKAAEEAKKLADERVDAVKELVSLQEKLIQQLIELAKAQREAMGGAGGGEPPGNGENPFGGGFPGNVTLPNIDEIIKKVEEAMADFWPDITASLSTAFQNAWNTFVPDTTQLTAAFENIKNLDWKGIGEDVTTMFAKLGEAFNKIDWKKLGEIFSSMWNSISKIFQNIDWEKVGNAISGAFEKVSSFLVDTDWNQVATDVQTFADGAGAKLEEIGNDIGEAWDTAARAVRDVSDSFKQGMNLTPGPVGIWGMGTPNQNPIVRAFQGVAALVGAEIGKVQKYMDKYGGYWKKYFDKLGKSTGFRVFVAVLLSLTWPLVAIENLFWLVANAAGEVVKTIVTLSDKFDRVKNSVQGIIDHIKDMTSGETFGQFVSDLISLGADIEEAWNGILALFGIQRGEGKAQPFKEEDTIPWKIRACVDKYIPGIPSIISTAFTNALTTISTISNQIYWKVVYWLKDILDEASVQWEDMKLKAETKWGEIKTSAVTKWEEIKKAITDKISGTAKAVWDKLVEVYEYFAGGKEKTGKIQEILTYLTSAEMIKNFSDAGAGMIQGLINGVGSMAQALLTAIVTLLQSAITEAIQTLQEHSPSKVFEKIGAGIPEGMAQGIQAKGTMPLAATAAMTTGTIMAAQQRVSAPSVYRTNNVAFGDVNINNGMDIATFRQMVLKVVAEGA